MRVDEVGGLYAVRTEDARRASLNAVFPRVIERKGFSFVPRALDSAVLLRNAGFTVDSPIKTQYSWPGKFKPMDHQVETASFLTMNKRAFCLNDMGTGKTLASYWAADYLMRIGVVRRCLVVAPLSTLQAVHADTIKMSFMGVNSRTVAVLHGTAKKRKELLAQNYDFYVVNFDGVATIAPQLELRDDIDLIIIDELANAYRNATTARWKVMKMALRPAQRVWGLTGLPIPNDPTDAWAQVKLIRPEALLPNYPSFRSFKFATMEQYSTYTWKPKSTAISTVASIFNPSIRYSRDECLTLPPCTVQTREVEMTTQQKSAYKELTRDLRTMVNGSKITALNEGVVRMKLLQISAGVVYDAMGVHQWIDCAPRLAVLRELLDEQATKTIVFAPFKGNIAFLLEALKDYSVVSVTGDTTFAARNKIFAEFQSPKGPRVLVAHPKCMSHGLTLTEAATIIWFAPYDDNEVVEQANARINRKGQDKSTSIIQLAASAIERGVYKRNLTKQGMQGLLLELLETT